MVTVLETLKKSKWVRLCLFFFIVYTQQLNILSCELKHRLVTILRAAIQRQRMEREREEDGEGDGRTTLSNGQERR